MRTACCNPADTAVYLAIAVVLQIDREVFGQADPELELQIVRVVLYTTAKDLSTEVLAKPACTTTRRCAPYAWKLL